MIRKYHNHKMQTTPWHRLHEGLGNSLVVRQEKHKPSCSLHAQQFKRTGGQTESSFQANFDRMVFGSGCLQPNSISYRLPKHRPVCDSCQQQTTSLCIPDSRRQSSSNRRSIAELGQDQCVCISSASSDSSNKQDSSTSGQNCSCKVSKGAKIRNRYNQNKTVVVSKEMKQYHVQDK